jgi:hypothetical protein
MVIEYLNETVDLLVRDPARSQPTFPYEREIRLYQFQTWIYFPKRSMVELAGSRAAVNYLRQRESKLVTRQFIGTRSVNSTELKRLLNDPIYRKLFDATIGKYGGWSELVQRLERTDFKREVYGRMENAETVCKMIDYRFRYLNHGGTDRKQANISHSEFYRWITGPTLSWRKIRERWSQNKRSAVFLYVSEGLGLRLSPRFRRMGYFPNGISQDAANSRHIRRFFGTCAYVSEILRGDDDETENEIRIPATVNRLRPTTQPLSQSDHENMSKYKSERDIMRAS